MHLFIHLFCNTLRAKSIVKGERNMIFFTDAMLVFL